MDTIFSKKQMSEEDIKLQYITPALLAKWDIKKITMETAPVNNFTDGKVLIKGNVPSRDKGKRCDYVLWYNRGTPLAIVEAKDNNHCSSYGMQQAISYGIMMNVPFVYTSNGDSFFEHDFTTGLEKEFPLSEFPTADELYARWKGVDSKKILEVESRERYELDGNVSVYDVPLCFEEKLLNTPFYSGSNCYPPRYYQRNAVNRTLAEWQEKVKLNPKAKKPAPIVASEIDEAEIPFVIPENWCWCKIQDICLVKGGKRIPAGTTLTEVDTGHKYIRVADMKNGSVIINNVKYITDEIHEKIKPYKISKDDVYITVAGTIGDSGIVPDELDNANLTENADKLVLFRGINKYCLHFFLSSGFVQEQILDAITKVGQPKLAIARIQNFILPLPPLAVQNAIVAKLEQVLPLVDAYENAVLEKEELKSDLPSKMKKAILQEAITGKLKIDNGKLKIGETGKQLLDRIITERNEKVLAEWQEKVKLNPKAKKPAPIVASEIDEDEIPFEIPENWCWCRLGDLVPFGQCVNAEPTEIEDNAWILDLEDIEKDSGRILQFKTKKEVESKSTKHIFKKGYVLYSKLRPYLNKCVIAPKDGYCTSEILPLDFGNLVNNKYAQTFLMSPYFVDYTNSLSFGVKMPRLGTEDGKKAMVPLPPLEEQNAIVEALEEVLPLCERE